MSFVKNLDIPLLRLSPNECFSLRQASEGLVVFGQIGAGKTSGSRRIRTSNGSSGLTKTNNVNAARGNSGKGRRGK